MSTIEYYDDEYGLPRNEELQKVIPDYRESRASSPRKDEVDLELAQLFSLPHQNTYLHLERAKSEVDGVATDADHVAVPPRINAIAEDDEISGTQSNYSAIPLFSSGQRLYTSPSLRHAVPSTGDYSAIPLFSSGQRLYTSPSLRHAVPSADVYGQNLAPFEPVSPSISSPKAERLPSIHQLTSSLTELAEAATQEIPRERQGFSHHHSQSFGLAISQSPILSEHVYPASVQTSPKAYYPTVITGRSLTSTLGESDYASPPVYPPHGAYPHHTASAQSPIQRSPALHPQQGTTSMSMESPLPRSQAMDDYDDGVDLLSSTFEDKPIEPQYPDYSITLQSLDENHMENEHRTFKHVATNITDSGYGTRPSFSKVDERSVIEDGTDSVATDENQIPIPGQDKFLLEVAFAREIRKKFSSLTLEHFAMHSEIATELLYDFSVMIGKRATSVAQKGAASFVRRGRNRIVGHVRKDLQPDDEDETRDSVDAMSLAEKMALWGVDSTTGDSSPKHTLQPESNGNECDYEEDEEDEEDQPFVPTEYAGLRDFLIESDEFDELSHDLELGLQIGEVDSWSNVRTRIAKELASLPRKPNDSSLGAYSLAINLPWSPRSFLREQYGHMPDVPTLSSVITLSGATGHIYAATSETYIHRTWPRYGPLVLCVLQDALDSRKTTFRSNMYHSSLEFRFHDDSTTAYATGYPLFISSAAEILVWLSTACRASVEPNSIQTCRMHLRKGTETKADLSFTAELESIEKVQNDNVSHADCWQGMFRNPVIAHNYPTPHRKPEEKGLELSLDLMLSLAQTFWAAIYDGFLLLKGFNTILAPTMKIDDSIIWHLTVNWKGDRLSYNAGSGSSCIQNVGDAIFVGARHFVGWTQSAKFLVASQGTWRLTCLTFKRPSVNEDLTALLGTQEAEYDRINFSGGSPTSAGLRAEAAVNFTAGKYLTLSSKVSRGIKDTPEYLASDDYVQSMDAAARMSVVLSDSATRQHWLADGASTVLHLCRAWLSNPHPGYIPGDSLAKLWSPQHAGSPSISLATLTSIDNRELELYVSHVKHLSKPSTSGTGREVLVEKQWFLLQDLAHRYFKWIEQIHDRANKIRHSPDFDLLRQGNKLIGFEFLDLLSGDHRVESYVYDLGSGAGAWLPYTRSKDTVHIFGSGFGELVQPTVATGKSRIECGQQSAAPHDADYLIAPLSVLKKGMERFQHTSTCAQISRGVYWWNVGEAFQKCRCQCLGLSSRCTSPVRKLHGKCVEEPSNRTPTCLPEVFERCPSAAIIMGYEPQLLTKIRLTTDSAVTKLPGPSVRQQSSTSGGARPQKRSPSDSGYASNIGNSSHDGQSSSLVSEGSPSEDFKIRGAAGEAEGRKLTKRRKTGR